VNNTPKPTHAPFAGKARSSPFPSRERGFCSFIVAVYNRERYVSQTIRSILSQTVNDFELVVVNDGSTDGSQQVVERFSIDKLKLFNIDHKGCWFAKNYGILQAKGQFCCFIDSDDYISPDFLEKAIAGITAEPDYEYYYPTALYIVKENGERTDSIWRYLDYPLDERWRLIDLFWQRQIGGIPHAAAFIRREVFDRCGLYNDTFFNLADTEYVINHALEIRFKMLPDLKHYYNRQHSQQTNANMNERHRTYSEILDGIIEKYPPQYYLGCETKGYEACVEKFISMSRATEYGGWYAEKAAKYLRKSRG